MKTLYLSNNFDFQTFKVQHITYNNEDLISVSDSFRFSDSFKF